jgi:hypothetical protein
VVLVEVVMRLFSFLRSEAEALLQLGGQFVGLVLLM